MESKFKIVDTLAREKAVETMIVNIAHQSLTADLKDLAQMVYLILLEYDEDKILDLWSHNQMKFFIARIIINQFRSSTSPYHTIYRKFRQMVDEDVEIVRDADRLVFDMFGSARVMTHED